MYIYIYIHICMYVYIYIYIYIYIYVYAPQAEVKKIIDDLVEEYQASGRSQRDGRGSVRDFGDRVYPFFESETLFLECVFVSLLLVV